MTTEPEAAPANPSDPYLASIESWHQGRLARLRSPSGWLSLVDRILLEPGDNQLPIGTATLTGETVSFRPAPGAAVTLGGVALEAEIVLRADDVGGPPDRLESGGRSYELIHRGEAFAIRVKDPRALALQTFPGIPRFPVDPRWRVIAAFERYQPTRIVRMSFEMGEGAPRVVPGIARFELEGQRLALEPILEPDSQRLFIVFGDLTNKRGDSYPGGRFLYADLPADAPTATVVLDFNLAFNPPCALTEFATCPALPPGNRLPLAVLAGERRYHALPVR